MAGIEFDISELQRLATDLADAGVALPDAIRPVVSRGALNIKNQMRAEMAASRHFRGAAGDIDYDLEDHGLAALIGPRSGRGQPGALANIAYFGTSRGGGTVPDPQEALDAETPRFLKALGDVMEGLM